MLLPFSCPMLLFASLSFDVEFLYDDKFNTGSLKEDELVPTKLSIIPGIPAAIKRPVSQMTFYISSFVFRLA